jgi:hypothetical protein
MEIYAAIAGLELLKQPCKVAIYSNRRCSRSSRREEAQTEKPNPQFG